MYTGRTSISEAACAAALLAIACSTRPPASDVAPPPPEIEVRGARGELELAMAPRSGGWALRQPGRRQQMVRANASGAEVLDLDRRVASLHPGPAGLALDVEGAPSLRITREGDRVDVIDARGVIVVAADGPVARDGSSHIIHTVEPGGDRLLIVGPEGERLGTVHNLPTGSPAAAAILAARAVDPRGRAALAAYLLSR